MVYLKSIMFNHPLRFMFIYPLHIRKFLFWLTFCLVSFLFVPLSAQTRRALVVGISDYPQSGDNSWAKIHGANDAELIAPVLITQGFKVVKICNKAATASKIRKELQSLVNSCKKGDIIFLQFSCHGQPFEDMNGDENDGWDESIIPYDALMVYSKGKYEGSNHITDDELHSYFQKLRRSVGTTGFVCAVIDACHAGNTYMGEDDEDDEEVFCRGVKKGFTPNGKVYRPRIDASGHFKIQQENGLANIVILEACRAYQSNYEIKQSGNYYGPLSYYISQVLNKKAITAKLDWVLEVKNMMDLDHRLARQNIVYETSLK